MSAMKSARMYTTAFQMLIKGNGTWLDFLLVYIQFFKLSSLLRVYLAVPFSFQAQFDPFGVVC